MFRAFLLLLGLLACDSWPHLTPDDWLGCAPAAGDSVLSYLGYKVGQESLARAMNTAPNGRTAADSVAPGIMRCVPTVIAYTVESDTYGVQSATTKSPRILLIHCEHAVALFAPCSIPGTPFAVVRVVP